MDFTVLGRTLEGCSSLYACCVEETQKHRQERTRMERERGEETKKRAQRKRELEQDMIRLSLGINLSEAVRTFLKVLNLHSKNCPPSPQTHCPCLGAIVTSLCTKIENTK